VAKHEFRSMVCNKDVVLKQAQAAAPCTSPATSAPVSKWPLANLLHPFLFCISDQRMLPKGCFSSIFSASSPLASLR
jgi:hypothetical protein